MRYRIAPSPSKTLLAVLSAFVGGIFFHAWDERVWMAWTLWCVCAGACATAAALLRHRPTARLITLAAAAFLLSFARYDVALVPDRTSSPDGSYRGVASAEPRRKGRSVLVSASDVVTPDGERLGRMTLLFRTMPDLRDGDAIAWRCRSALAAPVCEVAGAAAVLPSGPRPLVFLRTRLRGTVRAILPEPDASLLLGLLIGDRAGLPKDLVVAFRDTGTSHVLAASGYNVTLVAEAAVVIFALAGLARRRAAAATAGCIVLFALLCGGDPPVARAAIMGCVGLFAAALGRRYHAPNALMLAAALMLAYDPAALRHDAGFRLSFAAVAGLRAFGCPFASRLAWVPWEGARKALAETLGATVATLPLILHDFGILAPSAPLVNLAIAPLIPAAMAAGAAAVVAAFPSAALAAPFAFAADAPLALMRAAVNGGAKAVPAVQARAGLGMAAVLYGWIILLWYGLRRAEAKEELR